MRFVVLSVAAACAFAPGALAQDYQQMCLSKNAEAASFEGQAEPKIYNADVEHGELTGRKNGNQFAANQHVPGLTIPYQAYYDLQSKLTSAGNSLDSAATSTQWAADAYWSGWGFLDEADERYQLAQYQEAYPYYDAARNKFYDANTFADQAFGALGLADGYLDGAEAILAQYPPPGW